MSGGVDNRFPCVLRHQFWQDNDILPSRCRAHSKEIYIEIHVRYFVMQKKQKQQHDDDDRLL